VEVSWQSLRQIVREWAGSAADLQEVTPLAGGCINTTLKIQTKDGQTAVLKITPHRVDHAYTDEERQLGLLREIGIPTPQIYLCKTGSLDMPFSYLLMEFVEGIDLATAKTSLSPDEFNQIQSHLAELVLLLHSQRSPQYMRVSAQEPRQYDTWHQCYREIFDGIWMDVAKSGILPVKARKIVTKTHDRLDRLLAHDDGPRLTHWDLWSTNIMVRRDANGRWHVAALLDPHCKYAHCEAEVAYLELFHTVNSTFMRAYQEHHKLPNEYYRVRRNVYQLYSLINHVHLFGNNYLKSLLAAVDKVGELV
jgi:fructosamine-3-kinase